MTRFLIFVPSTRSWFLPGLMFLLATLTPTFADTIVLNNGDTITGTVEKLDSGKLTVATAYAGSIDITWDAVEQMDSEGNFDVSTATGRIYTGRVERADDKLVVRSDGEATELNILGVSGLAAITEESKPKFRDKVQVGFDWGYNITRGNSTLTQSALGATAQYTDSKQKLSGIVTSIQSSQNDAEATSRHAGDARYDRFIGDRAFAYGLGGLERNRQKLLDLRTKLGGGVGFKVINDASTSLSLLGGVNYSRENYFPDDMGVSVSSDSGEGTAGVEVKAVRFGGIELTSRLFLFPNLTDTGRYRFEFDSGVRLPVFKNFTYGMSFYDRFDSRPAVIVKKNDYGFISTLGYTF